MILYKDLSKQQKQSYKEIIDWLLDEESPTYKTLSGYAGTGKTTLLNNITRKALDEGINTIVTAPTNKAVKVLKNRVKNTKHRTTHSLLDIKPKRDGHKETFEAVYKPDGMINYYELVIIDECSMVSEKLFSIIEEKIPSKTKVLFCGDPAQLPPIGEERSKTFSFQPSILEEILRYGNEIEEAAVVPRGSKEVVDVEELYNPPHIIKGSREKLNEHFTDWRENPDNSRLLCWTNKRVMKWNKRLRKIDWQKEREEPFSIGDVVIANEPIKKNDNIVMLNSEEGRVEEIEEDTDAWILLVRKEVGGRVRVRVVKDVYKSKLKSDLQKYRRERNWKRFWSLMEYYHDIRHAYALTTHKSQGSTFENVFIDTKNIYLNRNIKERNQMLYVAMTRASEKVILV